MLVFATAGVARLCVALTSGGLFGNYGYDASVYYAAADALVHGRLPYRDFVMLHPPALMLTLTPFAWLGRLTSDQLGFATANVAFVVLGAINAVLVVRVAKAMGLGPRPALVGGLFYAVFFGAVSAEYLTRLEPLGSFLLLCGLLAYFAAARSASWHLPLVCGLCLGAAASTKIWWALPLLLIVLWQLPARRGWRAAAMTGAGAACAMLLIDGPFFLFAPGQMWHMVVTEQLGRSPSQVSVASRLASLSGVGRIAHLHGAAQLLIVGLLVAVALGICLLALRAPAGRLVVTLFAVQIALLLAAPSWFDFYADYAAAGLSLTIAAAAWRPKAHSEAPSRSRSPRLHTSRTIYGLVALAGIFTVGGLASGRNNIVKPFPSRRLAHAVVGYRCVMSDSPMALIALNVLSSDFAHGCRDWVDVTGRTYGPDRPDRTADGGYLPRPANQRWQRDLRSYLLSGNAVIIIRAAGTGLSHATTAAIEHGGVLATSGGYTIYRVP